MQNRNNTTSNEENIANNNPEAIDTLENLDLERRQLEIVSQRRRGMGSIKKFLLWTVGLLVLGGVIGGGTYGGLKNKKKKKDSDDNNSGGGPPVIVNPNPGPIAG